ncbi:hypothetical protein RRG08_051650 [Elysia crispata]|uniref:Uncharacterized protein n=1 Tax=Elysia crispata TaxID=231223 RepID=A0AAE1A3A9_9GAST|nr:hypothetical protein RRG08_051650 [Elysia crispata]
MSPPLVSNTNPLGRWSSDTLMLSQLLMVTLVNLARRLATGVVCRQNDCVGSNAMESVRSRQGLLYVDQPGVLEDRLWPPAELQVTAGTALNNRRPAPTIPTCTREMFYSAAKFKYSSPCIRYELNLRCSSSDLQGWQFGANAAAQTSGGVWESGYSGFVVEFLESPAIALCGLMVNRVVGVWEPCQLGWRGWESASTSMVDGNLHQVPQALMMHRSYNFGKYFFESCDITLVSVRRKRDRFIAYVVIRDAVYLFNWGFTDCGAEHVL